MQPKSEPMFVRALCTWFEHAARDLPWRKRKHRTGYGALVAEAMLQQTQVARVVERYPAFMLRFPNVRSLANALEQEVLEEWRGMGYYRRARSLHAAAQMIVRDFGGRVPSEASVLRQLPGVGRYTAGAIASIVFGKPEPIVDGNVMRVLARLYAKEGANGDAAAWTWETADRLVKLAQRSGTPRTLNEAMMELGATVCTPGRPKCATCPLQRFCAARARGLQNELPIARKRAKPQAWVHHALVVRRWRDGAVLFEQRPASGMWAGMWQVPTIEDGRALSLLQLRNRLAIQVSDIEPCGSFMHQTSHRAIRFCIYRAQSRQRQGMWLKLESTELARLPLSAAQRRVLAMIQSRAR